jgi:hypothetical protein
MAAKPQMAACQIRLSRSLPYKERLTVDVVESLHLAKRSNQLGGCKLRSGVRGYSGEERALLWFQKRERLAARDLGDPVCAKLPVVFTLRSQCSARGQDP